MPNLYYRVICSVLIWMRLWQLCIDEDFFFKPLRFIASVSPACFILASRPACTPVIEYLIQQGPPFPSSVHPPFFFLPRRRRRRQQQREEEETKEEAEEAGIRCATSGWERDRHPGRMSQRADSAIAASPRSDPPSAAETIPHFEAVVGLSLFRPPPVLLPHCLTIVSTEAGERGGVRHVCGPSGGSILGSFRTFIRREARSRR